MTKHSAAPTVHQSWTMSIEFPPPGEYEVVDLSHPLKVGIPHHPAHPPYSFTLTKKHGDVVTPNGVSGAAEMITTSGHLGTHIDGFSHIACDGKVLGGVSILEQQEYSTGMALHPINELAPFFVRGHYVDVPEFLGTPVPDDFEVDESMLSAWADANDVEVKSGDVVFIRTGWDVLWESPAEYVGHSGSVPGVSLSGARWLNDRGVRAAGTDTIAFEKTPTPNLEVHAYLLGRCGISIIEAMNLRPLAEYGTRSFFVSFSPINIAGGTGSPIRPLAFIGK